MFLRIFDALFRRKEKHGTCCELCPHQVPCYRRRIKEMPTAADVHALSADVAALSQELRNRATVSQDR